MKTVKSQTKKKRFPVFIGVGMILSVILAGCSSSSSGGEHYGANYNFISIKNKSDLYYYSDTRIVYIMFSQVSQGGGYGYLAPYYSENGKLCIYDSEKEQIVELDK